METKYVISVFFLNFILHIRCWCVDAFIFFRTLHDVEERPPEEETEYSSRDSALPEDQSCPFAAVDDGLDPQENKRGKRKCCLCNVV